MSFLQEIFQGGLKLRPLSKRMKSTTAAVHKLKWGLDSEKSVEKSFEFGPNTGPGCHLESLGLTPGPLSGNAILRI